MELVNYDLKRKREELEDLAQEAISRFSWAQSSTSIAKSAVQAFAQITPPPDDISIVYGSLEEAYSRKPGNIYLNWKKLINIVPDVTILAVKGLEAPDWLVPLIGLHIWNKLWTGAVEDLSEVEATIIYALWKNRDSKNKISEDDGYAKAILIRNHFDMPDLSRSEYNIAINHLLKIKCIEIEEGIVWLREWVRIKY